MAVVPNAPATGLVETFDDPRGLGEVRTDAGDVLTFHCTAIADGSRTIAEGTPVRCTVVAGHLGRWEAADITPL